MNSVSSDKQHFRNQTVANAYSRLAEKRGVVHHLVIAAHQKFWCGIVPKIDRQTTKRTGHFFSGYVCLPKNFSATQLRFFYTAHRIEKLIKAEGLILVKLPGGGSDSESKGLLHFSDVSRL
jgi:hypothetical protein